MSSGNRHYHDAAERRSPRFFTMRYCDDGLGLTASARALNSVGIDVTEIRSLGVDLSLRMHSVYGCEWKHSRLLWKLEYASSPYFKL